MRRAAAELEQAVGSARPGDTILLADGTYGLRRSIDIATARVTLRGRSGNPSAVILRGGGMTGDPVGVGISVSAPDVTIADMTIRDLGYHAIQVRGERSASRFAMHRARLFDTGHNRKTDALDAHSIAVVAVRTEGPAGAGRRR